MQDSLKSDKYNGYCNEDILTFMTISRSVLLRMGDVSRQSCRENQNKYFMFNNLFPIIVPVKFYIPASVLKELCMLVTRYSYVFQVW